MTIDLTARGFSLANARVCADASAEAYSGPATVQSDVDGTGVVITELADCVVVAFEGSKNPRQFITDADAWRRNMDGCSLHAGFYKVLVSVVYQINARLGSKPLILTGHSLGGALAQLAAYWLKSVGREIHSVYTYGSPRIGDALGVKLYGDLAERTYRVTNGADIVPWCPGWLCGYRHTAQEYWMSSIGGLVTNPVLMATFPADLWEIAHEWARHDLALLTDHFIQSYITRLGRL